MGVTTGSALVDGFLKALQARGLSKQAALQAIDAAVSFDPEIAEEFRKTAYNPYNPLDWYEKNVHQGGPLVQTGELAASMVPVAGAIPPAINAINDLRAGNYLAGGANALQSGISALPIPEAGPTAGLAARTVAKWLGTAAPTVAKVLPAARIGVPLAGAALHGFQAQQGYQAPVSADPMQGRPPGSPKLAAAPPPVHGIGPAPTMHPATPWHQHPYTHAGALFAASMLPMAIPAAYQALRPHSRDEQMREAAQASGWHLSEAAGLGDPAALTKAVQGMHPGAADALQRIYANPKQRLALTDQNQASDTAYWLHQHAARNNKLTGEQLYNLYSQQKTGSDMHKRAVGEPELPPVDPMREYLSQWRYGRQPPAVTVNNVQAAPPLAPSEPTAAAPVTTSAPASSWTGPGSFLHGLGHYAGVGLGGVTGTMLGGLGGGAAGAALGTLGGPVGTALGGVIGPVTGGISGGYLGANMGGDFADWMMGDKPAKVAGVARLGSWAMRRGASMNKRGGIGGVLGRLGAKAMLGKPSWEKAMAKGGASVPLPPPPLHPRQPYVPASIPIQPSMSVSGQKPVRKTEARGQRHQFLPPSTPLAPKPAALPPSSTLTAPPTFGSSPFPPPIPPLPSSAWPAAGPNPTPPPVPQPPVAAPVATPPVATPIPPPPVAPVAPTPPVATPVQPPTAASPPVIPPGPTATTSRPSWRGRAAKALGATALAGGAAALGGYGIYNSVVPPWREEDEKKKLKLQGEREMRDDKRRSERVWERDFRKAGWDRLRQVPGALLSGLQATGRGIASVSRRAGQGVGGLMEGAANRGQVATPNLFPDWREKARNMAVQGGRRTGQWLQRNPHALAAGAGLAVGAGQIGYNLGANKDEPVKKAGLSEILASLKGYGQQGADFLGEQAGKIGPMLGAGAEMAGQGASRFGDMLGQGTSRFGDLLGGAELPSRLHGMTPAKGYAAHGLRSLGDLMKQHSGLTGGLAAGGLGLAGLAAVHRLMTHKKRRRPMAYYQNF